MEDSAIIDLYWSRDEQAVAETARKYGSYCRAIAQNILKNRDDSDECVNDTYMRAWNAIPPQRPVILSVFLGTITRNLALNRYREYRAGKRGGGQMPLALEELEYCLAQRDTAESYMEATELGRIIDSFLRQLPEGERMIFLRRYWYVDSLRDIARRYHISEGTVKSKLFRTRQKLIKHLEKEGVTV